MWLIGTWSHQMASIVVRFAGEAGSAETLSYLENADAHELALPEMIGAAPNFAAQRTHFVRRWPSVVLRLYYKYVGKVGA